MLATRKRQAAATCDFSSITDPLDEALRTRFICSINNEAVLKALFKINTDELTFTRAIKVATKTEDLTDAYNQSQLAPESRKRLALSTHRGVLIRNVLPFGISFTPGC